MRLTFILHLVISIPVILLAGLFYLLLITVEWFLNLIIDFSIVGCLDWYSTMFEAARKRISK